MFVLNSDGMEIIISFNHKYLSILVILLSEIPPFVCMFWRYNSISIICTIEIKQYLFQGKHHDKFSVTHSTFVS